MVQKMKSRRMLNIACFMSCFLTGQKNGSFQWKRCPHTSNKFDIGKVNIREKYCNTENAIDRMSPYIHRIQYWRSLSLCTLLWSGPFITQPANGPFSFSPLWGYHKCGQMYLIQPILPNVFLPSQFIVGDFWNAYIKIF